MGPGNTAISGKDRMSLTFNADISTMNTFGMKARAACLAEYYSVDELDAISRRDDLPQPLKSIGGGSNILLTGDFPGTILHSKIRFIETYGDDEIVSARVGAGVPWDEFCEWSAKRDLWGPENLSMIPGDTGAAAVQNIGAYGTEIADITATVECYDLMSHKMMAFKKEDCRYAYRDSFFKSDEGRRYVVTAVTFILKRGYSPVLEYGDIKDRIIKTCGAFVVYGNSLTPGLVRRCIMDTRREKLPDTKERGNAGSFFRNPYVTKEKLDSLQRENPSAGIPHYDLPDGSVKIPAAWLIDRCGWKGKHEGGAAVWEMQPLVLVNASGCATAEDVLALEEKIKASVRERFGIELIPEVEHL